MTDRRAHLYSADDLSRPLCGTKVRWLESPTPDEAETCLTCDRILSDRYSAGYGGTENDDG